MWTARIRLIFLWLSQVARVMADNCLRIFVVLELARAGTAQRDGAWHLATAVMMLPAIFLAPLNGALGNSLPKSLVLSGSAAFCLLAVSIFAFLNGAWLACWALVAAGAAIYGPARYAMLPAAAKDARVPLTLVNGWIDMGAMIAVAAGLFLGYGVHGYFWRDFATALVLAVSLSVIGLLAALPVRFASDVRRPEPPGAALLGFFRDCRRIFGARETRFCLLGLAGLRGLMTAVTGALVAATLNGTFDLEKMLAVAGWVLLGLAAGSFLAGLNRHPRRVLGLVPIGASGLAAGLVLPALGIVPSGPLCVVLGIMGGLVNVPLSSTYQADLPADARGNGMAVRYLADAVANTLMAGLMVGLTYLEILSVSGQFWLVAALAGLAAFLSWRALLREFLELMIEFAIWPLYRIRAQGPGLDSFPSNGPLIVVANHSAWFDPIWLAKVLPRRFIPLMTSVFYDLPVMRWLMVHVAHAIRVQAATFRREVPEIKEAIAALDRGESLMIFPEGGMRRSEEKLLRPFGQGVWHILRARPATPVVVCWIEGGWGSYFSYCKGPPTKNKRFDIWRHLDVGVSAPQILSGELLDNHKSTRAYLMHACLDARRHLNLEVPEKIEAIPDLKDEEGTPSAEIS